MPTPQVPCPDTEFQKVGNNRGSRNHECHVSFLWKWTVTDWDYDTGLFCSVDHNPGRGLLGSVRDKIKSQLCHLSLCDSG